MPLVLSLTACDAHSHSAMNTIAYSHLPPPPPSLSLCVSLSLSGLKGDSWELSHVVGPTELGQSEERLGEKLEILKISTQEGEECV